ncbi:MAG: DUF1287 domain-containing protein [Lysobacter sp.]|nr:DUF1287 domain-containing protein [Lysobacter sp.]
MSLAVGRRARQLLALSCALALGACTDSTAQTAPQRRLDEARATPPVAPRGVALAIAARRQIGVTIRYDPAYTRIAYPGGDVPEARGVCTDVVIRALRTRGVDLQQRVHEDMRAHFAAYPQKWGLRGPDSNIDHRRVPNLQTWFARQGWSVAVTDRAADYRAGDLVTWMLPGNLPHIGIVSERKTMLRGVPLVIHNIGRGTREDDILFAYEITGHYRPKMQ